MIIYLATNILNNKKYIGITTKTLEHRMKIHKKDSVNKNTYFYRAIRKYGFENFKWEVIDTANTIDELHEKEKYYIALYDTFDNKNKGYNSTSGGGSLYDVTEELKKLRSERAKGKNNPMYGVPSPLKGTKFTKEHRDRISKSLSNSYRPHVIGGRNSSAKKVRNVETGEIFDTMTEAGKKYDTHRCNIGNACRKKTTAKGYHWEYIE